MAVRLRLYFYHRDNMLRGRFIIASQSIGADSKLTPEERTEAMLDLHGLHAAEATEVLEEFLLAV